MIRKFFTLKVCESNGMCHKATWKERVHWVLKGCPLRDEKVVKRYVRMKHRV